MALLTWNDVKVLNPTTGLYEAYLTRTKQYTPGSGVSCLNFVGSNQCAFQRRLRRNVGVSLYDALMGDGDCVAKPVQE